MWDTFEEVTFEQGKSGGQELPGREKSSCKVVKEEMHLQRKNILVERSEQGGKLRDEVRKMCAVGQVGLYQPEKGLAFF